jgi:hypothetical protein
MLISIQQMNHNFTGSRTLRLEPGYFSRNPLGARGYGVIVSDRRGTDDKVALAHRDATLVRWVWQL